jgi:predicted NAD/FAD-binding protein
MGFSVRDDEQNLEYSGHSLGGMFAQKQNLFRPRMYKMIQEILRFNKRSKEFLDSENTEIGLEEYLLQNKYSRRFIDSFIIPMGAAIWSSSPDDMRNFPAYFFIRFFQNHGFLNLTDRVIWRTVKGGSKSYVDAILDKFQGNIFLNKPVESVKRLEKSVELKIKGGVIEYDHVIFACHSDQALKLLLDPSQEENDILSAMAYQKNTAILHTDETLLPKNKSAWTSWNFLKRENDKLCVSYNMNILQSIDSPETFIVTLNADNIDKSKIIRTIEYTHPLFTKTFVNAQSRWAEINGKRNTSYCGAYWRNGFHEDGVVSAQGVCEQLGIKL